MPRGLCYGSAIRGGLGEWGQAAPYVTRQFEFPAPHRESSRNMAAVDFLPVCDLLFNLISLTCYFCDVVFVSMVTYTLYDYTGGTAGGTCCSKWLSKEFLNILGGNTVLFMKFI